jgi:site-specific DNA-methyltransferase (adenine-specific)
MKPYYEHDGITIYHGDCREILPTLKADVVVTDPPYGTNAYSWDKLPPNILIGPRAVFGRLPEMLPLLTSAPDLVLTWWPSNGDCIGRSRSGVHRQAHIIAVWGHEGEVRKRNAAASSIRMGWTKPALMPDVWTDPHPHAGFHKTNYSHPTEKPVSLMGRLIRLMGSHPIVLDPFMGSGTTLVAAKLEGRRAIGIEIEERYCEIAAKRLAQGVLQFP